VRSRRPGLAALVATAMLGCAGAPPPEGRATAPSGPPPAAASPAIQIAISAPGDQARVERERVGLAGIVSSRAGIRRVVVTVDGVLAAARDEPTLPPSVALDLPLTLREGANSIVVAVTDGTGVTRRDARTVHHVRVVPLAVTVREPADGARLDSPRVAVRAVATSSRGVTAVAVTVNGVEVHREAVPAAAPSVAVATHVPLREGVNAVVVSAVEADGTVRQELRTVTYQPPKGPVADRWAVVIGIGDYHDAGIPRLRYAVADAEAVARVLVDVIGLRPDRVLLLTDRTARKPTLRNIRWALGRHLARVAKRDDTVLIFFAGHGAPEIDPSGGEPDGLGKCLVPLDADPDDLFATALPMADVDTIFRRIEAERVVVFLDTCYSGAAAAGGRTFAPARPRAAPVDDGFLGRLTRGKGRAIITAARPAEVSLELPELGHGVFTYHLLRALRGAADLDGDGVVALQELYAYLDREVTRAARAAGGNQHPVMRGELEGTLPLARVPPP
jgi:hypothetical protein